MNKPIKFFALFIGLLLFSASISINTLAAETPQEAEQTPYLYGVYYNENGDKVDGNALTSGEYTVDIMLEGIDGISVFQYTAEYDPSVVISISTDAVIADDTDMSLGGIKTADAENGKKRVAVALASAASRYTSLDAETATPITTMSVIVDAGDGKIDFKKYFDFVTDSDLTFLEDDYNNGLEDAYVLDPSIPTTYATSLMTADITPENELEPNEEITISGKVVIAADITGGASNYGAGGIYFMVDGEYLTDDNGNRIVTSEEADHYGEFTITLPSGTTEFQVVPGLSERMARTVTVNVTSSYTDAVIPVFLSDYNNDGDANALDMTIFKGYLKSYNYYGDYNNDEDCNALDMTIFKGFYNKTLSYDEDIVLND